MPCSRGRRSPGYGTGAVCRLSYRADRHRAQVRRGGYADIATCRVRRPGAGEPAATRRSCDVQRASGAVLRRCGRRAVVSTYGGRAALPQVAPDAADELSPQTVQRVALGGNHDDGRKLIQPPLL